MTHIPERTCIVCRKKGSKENFIKLVKNKDGLIEIEKDKKLDGRGIYICNNNDCLEKCKKTRAINKILKSNVPESVYEELNNEFRKS